MLLRSAFPALYLVGALACGCSESSEGASSSSIDDGGEPDAAVFDGGTGAAGHSSGGATHSGGAASTAGRNAGGGSSGGRAATGGTAAAGGAHAGGAPGPGGATATGGATDAGSEAGADAGVCAGAAPEAPCAQEGAACGDPCTSACDFCNRLVCTGGRWSGVEVFPAPCFDCGPDARCQAYAEYCDVQHSDVGGEPDVHSCKDTPESCASNVSCECVQAAASSDRCTAGGAGELTVEHLGG